MNAPSRWDRWRSWWRSSGGWRTPTVLQLEAAECGAASLAMVLGYHGCFVPLDELRTLCGVTRDGAKASSVLRAGRSFGLQARGLKAEPQHLVDLPRPLIAFVDFNHFLVVDDIDANSVWLNDPASGRRKETLAEFSPSFTGVVLTFEPTPTFSRGDTRPALWASLRERFRGLEAALAFCVLVSLLLVVPGLLLPVFARIFVDYVLVRSIDDWLLPIALGMGITAVARGALELVRGHVLLAARTTMALRTGHRLMARLLRLPIGYFEQRFAGEIADRLRLDEALSELLTGKLAQALVGLVTATFFLLAMFAYHAGIAAAVFGLALVNAGVLWWSTRWLAERYRKVSLDHGKLVGARIAGLKDIETFKASGSEDMLFARWQGLRVAVANGEQEIARAMAWLGPLPTLLAALGHALVLVGGGFAVIAGQLSLGELVALQTLAASFTAPVAELAGFGAELQQIRSYTARLDDVLAQPEDPLASRPLLGQADGLAQGRVCLRGIAFGYAPLDPPLLADIDLDLVPGKRVALVGASGSGKTTLGKLIAGLIAPRDGDYTIDGKPLAAHPRAELAARLAYVGQQPMLFEDSVRANATLWDDSLGDAAVVRAAHDASIHDVIAARAGAYAAAVAEGGANFSGGERQRLELARALATEPSILVLDEATSALDALTEQAVLESVRRRGAACVVIAHRLSAIRDCDEIVVLAQGRVVERGSHSSLLAAGGEYARLVEA